MKIGNIIVGLVAFFTIAILACFWLFVPDEEGITAENSCGHHAMCGGHAIEEYYLDIGTNARINVELANNGTMLLVISSGACEDVNLHSYFESFKKLMSEIEGLDKEKFKGINEVHFDFYKEFVQSSNDVKEIQDALIVYLSKHYNANFQRSTEEAIDGLITLRKVSS